MFCPKCGTELKEGAKFCAKCGSQIGRPSASPAAQPVPPPKQPKKTGLIIVLLLLLLLLVIGIGGGMIYYLNFRDSGSTMAAAREKEERTTEEETEDGGEETLEETNVPGTQETMMPTTAAVPTMNQPAPTAPPTVASTTPVQESLTTSVQYANQLDFTGLVRAGMVKATAYDSSHVVQGDRTIDNTGWSAFDGQATTSWQEGVTGDGIGQYAGISFDREYQVQAITLLVGNHRSDSWYVKNNVPQTLSINLSGQVFQVTLPKEKTEFAVVLSRPVAASDIRITIDGVYRGTEYTDTVVAEVGVYGN